MVIGFKRLWLVLKRTGMFKVALGFVAFLCFSAIMLRIFEPSIHNIGEGFWYCFVAAMTIGFGDIVPVSVFGKIITIIVTLYGVFVVAMIPDVVVSYFTEYLHIKEKETVSKFLEKLENLPNLSKEELEEISEKIKEFHKKKLK